MFLEEEMKLIESMMEEEFYIMLLNPLNLEILDLLRRAFQFYP